MRLPGQIRVTGADIAVVWDKPLEILAEGEAAFDADDAVDIMIFGR